MADLTPLVVALATARADAAHFEESVRVLLEQFETIHAEVLAARARAVDAAATADAALRAAVLEAFRDTGDVAPAPGCKVVQRTVLDYDAAVALDWAKGSGLALTLDKKAFEKVAKATPIPGVTIRQEPSVTVASDLSAYAVHPTISE